MSSTKQTDEEIAFNQAQELARLESKFKASDPRLKNPATDVQRRFAKLWSKRLLILFALFVVIGNAVIFVKRRSPSDKSEIAFTNGGSDTLIISCRYGIGGTLIGKFHQKNEGLACDKTLKCIPLSDNNSILITTSYFDDDYSTGLKKLLFIDPWLGFTRNYKKFHSHHDYHTKCVRKNILENSNIDFDKPFYFEITSSGGYSLPMPMSADLRKCDKK